MKKYVLMLASAAFALMLFADNASAQLKVGFGYSLGQQVTKSGDYKETAGYNGFNVGGIYEIDFLNEKWGNLGLQTGLNYEFLAKGEKPEETYGITRKENTSEHYLNIPVMAKYGYDIIPGTFGAYIAAGPTLSFGLASQTSLSYKGDFLGEKLDGKAVYHNYSGKVTTKNLPKEFEENMNEYGRMSNYGWFDVKLGLALGFEVFEALDIRLGYNWGLVNRYTGEAKDRLKMHTNNFYLTLSYCF